MKTPIITSAHQFTADDYDSDRLPFSPATYARLKYGDDSIAKRFGFELADAFFNQHADSFTPDQRIVVIPSPYNFVKNAATVMTDHFVRRLNRLLVVKNGMHVDYATIQRKNTYSGDFGDLDAETRRKLIGNDVFYVNGEFFKGKTLLFADDIRITGAHEERLISLMSERPQLHDSDIHFVYYAQLCGDTSRNDIEAALNNAGMTLDGYLKLQKKPGNHLIVRPIKWLLRMDQRDFEYFTRRAGTDVLTKLYDACLGEGYYSMPDYKDNFNTLQKIIDKMESKRVIRFSDHQTG